MSLALVCPMPSSRRPSARSSTSCWPTWPAVGLPGFPVSVAGDEVARSKPDPLPYLRAAELLGIDITRAIVLEDSANGVRAGWSAGATVVAVPHVVPIEPGERIVVRTSLVGLDVAELAALVGPRS